MCAKPEPFSYYQPVAELHEEVPTNVLRGFGWAGAQAFYGLLENI